MKNKLLYYIIAGETSGDQHAALLMKELLIINKNISFEGVGGNNMSKLNFKSLFPIQSLSVMGFWEVLKKLSFFKTVQDSIINDIKFKNPDRIILIDYPGLNLRLAKKIKSFSNIKITYYITPQVWAWKENRINILNSFVDQLLVIFPFEEEYFRKKNIAANFVGHPFFDEWSPSLSKNLKFKLNLNVNNPVLTLFPGSRKDEIKKHINIFIKTALLIKKEIKNLQIVVGCAPNMIINDYISIPKDVLIEDKNPRDALECADFALLASGTATIEASIFNTPSVIIYKSSFFSWLIAKFVIKTSYIGMCNLIANKMIMPEFIQFKAKPKKISKEILKLYNNKSYYNQKIKDLKIVSKKLGKPGASRRASNFIIGDENN